MAGHPTLDGFRLAAIVLASLAVAGVLAGCDRRANGTDSATASDPVVLRRGNGGDPLTLDPALAQDEHAFAILADLYEGLTVIGENGGLVAGAARSWQVSDDGLRYRFRLRNDGRWSDGRPVRAQDFIAGFRRTLDPSAGSAYAFLLEPVRGAPEIVAGRAPPEALGVRAIDDLTLEVLLAEPTPALPARLSLPAAYPFPAGDEPVPGRFTDPGRFVGNGAYRLAEWTTGSRIRLTRNPAFRAADSVAIDVVEYFAITDSQTELNMYRSGELDLTATVPGDALAMLETRRPGELRIAPRLGLYYLAFDLGEAPLDDPQLRQALSMALDRDRITELVGRGEQPAFGIVPAGIGNYEPARYDWAELPADERLAEARRLYGDAGFGAERPLKLTLVYDTGSVHETVALAVQAMWSALPGAEVTLDRREWQYFLATREQHADWDAMRFAWTGDYPHPQTFLDIFRADNPQNLPGYASAEYDRRLALAGRATGVAAQADALRRAERRLLEEYPVAPVYFYVSKHLVAPSVHGFHANPLDLNPTRFLRKSH